MNKQTKYIIYLLIFLIIFTWLGISSVPDNKLHIYACDVGQGDGLLISKGNTQIVVDGGPNNNINKCLNKYLPFWDRHLDMLVVTNADKDHYWGFIETLNQYSVDSFVATPIKKDSSEYLKLISKVQENNLKVINPYAGDTLSINDLFIDIVWPTVSEIGSTNMSETNVLGVVDPQGSVNAASIVFTLKYKQFSMLFTGDIMPPVVDDIVATGRLSDVNIIKVPHHGSKNGLTEDLVRASSPEEAIISVGLDNQWGHPNDESLSVLRSKAVVVYRTDQMGDIEIITDGSSYQILP